MTRFGSLVALAAVSLGACALKGDVRRVEQEVQALKQETARADSVRAVVLDQVLAFQQRLLDSLVVLQRRLARFQGDVRSDMTEVQRQLVQIQELTGQSQQRISEMRAQLDARLRQSVIPGIPAPGDTAAAVAPAGGIDPEELFQVSLQQLRRGSPLTARQGFRKLLTDFPDHPRAVDAQFFVGDSWEDSDPDSAAAAYERVVRDYRDSPRAPTALYRLGLIAERRGDRRAAEVYYSRVIAAYPRSEEAQLARTKLGNPDR
ncbi:MAG: tetratricopeptide repeat protein [Gemmatimonadales bacterium]|nr:tetratricopeptide repeat protein [Gemmatimonadales bacterium]NIN09865.1 tetratricopeptide repeat protein [Gemmatimonadales bacterium]NIN48569.1 tetratricopeptide repeat protein [Gemmatimonadales bacterium]NIP06033.1 tetratricopeptide repeat protein [Gemmatimonadales bacterium]NIR01179.1 tetratricopeptide repeat protein [Gemmatimonadales bacterium]